MGGFNKIIRNIVAGASDTEFEKVSYFTNFLFEIEVNKSNVSLRQ